MRRRTTAAGWPEVSCEAPPPRKSPLNKPWLLAVVVICCTLSVLFVVAWVCQRMGFFSWFLHWARKVRYVLKGRPSGRVSIVTAVLADAGVCVCMCACVRACAAAHACDADKGAVTTSLHRLCCDTVWDDGEEAMAACMGGRVSWSHPTQPATMINTHLISPPFILQCWRSRSHQC